MNKFIFLFLTISLFFSIENVMAEISLPRVLNDHMVLQRNQAVKIWGWASPNEQVDVFIAGQWSRTQANQDGEWLVRLAAMPAGGPYQLIIQGAENTISLTNILIGDVWFCSGQSNMATLMANTVDANETFKSEDALQIRYFSIEENIKYKEFTDLPRGDWLVAGSDNIHTFAAVAYHFAKHLGKALPNVPIGIIKSAIGGSPVESWTRSDDLPPNHTYPAKAQHQEASVLYNGMIHPVINYTIKGFVWYQGETNRFWADTYHQTFPNMIRSWRNLWQQGDLPFLYVQLSQYEDPDVTLVDAWAKVREGQRLALKEPNTAMITTIDIGAANNIHPENKNAVGQRLAWAALDLVYQKETLYSGPLLKNHRIKNNTIIADFYLKGSGLSKGKEGNDATLGGFTIAGEDGVFFPAEANISNDKLVIHTDFVNSPKYVRYAWANNPKDANLFNKEGFGASPFSIHIKRKKSALSNLELIKPLTYSLNGDNGIAINGGNKSSINTINKKEEITHKIYSTNNNFLLKYELPKNAFVRLAVYNLSGQEVTILKNGEQQMEGQHQINIDGSDLPRAMYIYHLQADERVVSGKMMLGH